MENNRNLESSQERAKHDKQHLGANTLTLTSTQANLLVGRCNFINFSIKVAEHSTVRQMTKRKVQRASAHQWVPRETYITQICCYTSFQHWAAKDQPGTILISFFVFV